MEWDRDPTPFVVLAECKVGTTLRRASHSDYQQLTAVPLEAVPEVMTRDPCWKGDRWEFDNGPPSSVCSVLDTWVHTGVDTWKQDNVCLLRLQNRGFVFEAFDPTLLEQGGGI